MTEIWSATQNGKGFEAALEKKGWILARGDRRDFVASIQKAGRTACRAGSRERRRKMCGRGWPTSI